MGMKDAINDITMVTTGGSLCNKTLLLVWNNKSEYNDPSESMVTMTTWCHTLKPFYRSHFSNSDIKTILTKCLIFPMGQDRVILKIDRTFTWCHVQENIKIVFFASEWMNAFTCHWLLANWIYPPKIDAVFPESTCKARGKFFCSHWFVFFNWDNFQKCQTFSHGTRPNYSKDRSLY